MNLLQNVNLSKKPYSLEMYIAKPNKTIISPDLSEATDKKLKIILSGVHELSFSLPLQVDKKKQNVLNPNIKKLKEQFNLKVNFGKYEEWMVIDKVARNMESNSYDVTCYSLAYRLKKKRVQNYVVDAKSIATVLNDTLTQTGWKVGEIDSVLLSKYRSFDVSSSNKLDFLNDVAEKYSAVLIYNNTLRTVNMYDPENVGTDLGLCFMYGQYLEDLNYDENYDEVYTHLRVTGAEDIGIHAYNPTGLGYLIDYSHYLYPFERDANRNVIQHSNYMEDDLAHAVMDFMMKIDARKNDFNTYLNQINTFQTQLTTKQNEKATLTLELNQILDSIAVKQEVSQDTTTLQAQKTAKDNQITAKNTEISSLNAQIATINNNIESLKLDLAYLTNFTSEQYEELVLNYIHEGEVSETNISDELELYEYGLEQMVLKRSPVINLSLSVLNFLRCLSEQRNWNKLIIGDQISVSNSKLGVEIKANLSTIEYDFENNDIQVEIKDIKKKTMDEVRYFKRLMKFHETEKSQKAAKLALDNLTYNFNTRNDRISATPADPIIPNDGTAIDHTMNTDGSVNISFEWKYNPTNSQADEYNIDGFIVSLRTLSTNEKYTFGSAIAKEDQRELPADKRAIIISGVPANKYYTFGIQAYRRVDEDIAATGILTSNVVKSLYANENPYQPSATVPFYGNVLGTIDGQNVDSSRIVGWDTAEANAKSYTDQQIDEVNDSLTQLDTNIDSLFSDGVITSIEANSLDYSLTQVKKESEDLLAVASSLGITTERTAYANALTALENELSANWLYQSSYPKNITIAQRNAIKTRFSTVQDCKTKLINKISSVRQSNATAYIDTEIEEVNSVLNTIDTQISLFSSDLSITLAEANALELSYAQVVKESTDIVGVANSLGISTERTNYSSALTALGTEINKWINKTYPLAITSTDRTNVQTRFENVQSTKSILINKISAIREANSKTYADQQISEFDFSLTTLTNQINDFSSDGKLTLAEANSLESSLAQVKKESEDIVTIATILSISTERTNYSTAITNLQTEMNNWINKTTYPLTITSANRTSIQVKFEAVQSTKSILINKIASVREQNAKDYTDTTANAKLAEIAADNKLTPIEKSSTKLEWDVIVSEKTTIESQATTYGITTEKTAYTTAYNTLNTYITPLLANLTVTSDIVGDTFRTNFKNYYDKKTILLKAISDAAKAIADNAYDYATTPNVNLIQNGGAEICTGKYGTGIPDGWFIYQPSNLVSFTRRTSDTWTIAGNSSFEIFAGSSTTNTNGVYFQDYLAPTVGKTYTLSAKFGTHRCSGFIQMAFLNSSGNSISAYDVTKNSDSATTTVSKVSAVCPSSAVRIRVHIGKNTTTSGQSNSYLFADNVKLEEGDKATAYIEPGNADAINNGVQLGQKYNNVETNSVDGVKVTNTDGSVSKLNGDGLEIHGGNVKMYDTSGRLVMDGRGVNPLETSGWGITTGLTMGITSFTKNTFIEMQYVGADIESAFYSGVTLQLASVAGLPASGQLYVAGSGFLSNTIYYSSVNTANKTIVTTTGTACAGLRNGSILWDRDPSGTINVQVKSGSAILKNGVYVNVPNDVNLSIPVSSGTNDADGWQYRVVYLSSTGQVTYMITGTSNGVVDEWNIDVYPDNPRRNNTDPNAVILGVILCGGNSIAKKPFGAYAIMHPDFRDERAVKVIDKTTTGGKYAETIQKSLLATSSGAYGSWANSSITLSAGQNYTIAVPIGQGKRVATVSLSSATSLTSMDDTPYNGAVLFLGLKDPCKTVTQPKIAIGSGNFVDNGYVDGIGKYLVMPSAMGWNYRYIRDAWLEIGADGEVYLKLELYQWTDTETRAIRLNWMCW